MTSDNQVSILNDLITKSYDAEIGYKEAAENVNTPNLKNIFHEQAKNRYDFGHQIKDEIKKLDGKVTKGDSLAATAHRAWIDVKAAFSSNEDKAVLNEVVRGEDYAIKAYEDALEQLPIQTSAYDVLVNQRNSIRSAKERMETLELIADAPMVK